MRLEPLIAKKFEMKGSEKSRQSLLDEGAMSPLEKKRIAAVKTADAINAIEGAPISSYARSLSASWARGELTGEQMKQALLAHHRRIADQERQSRV